MQHPTSDSVPAYPVRIPARITLTYLIVGVLWIAFSDQVVTAISLNVAMLNVLQTLKGWAYVAATAAMLYWLIRRDISVLQRTENERWRTELKYRDLIDQAADGILICSEAGSFLEVNRASCEMLGYTPDEIRQHGVCDVIPVDDLAADPLHLAELHAGRAMLVERRMRRKDGATFPAEINVKQLADSRIQAIVRDVTERYKTADALRVAEAKYRTLIEQMPAIAYIAALDEAGHTLFASPQVGYMVGFSAKAWTADPALWLKQLHPEDRERVVAEKAHSYESGEPFRTEYRLLTHDGHIVWIRDEAIVTHDAATQRPVLQGVMLDITERQETEIAEREQRALAEALRDTAKALSSTLDVNEVLDRILANVGRVVPHDAATIMLIDQNRNEAQPVRWRGYAERNLEEWVGSARLRLDETANLQQMMATRKPLLIADTHTYPDWVRIPQAHWIRSNVGAPICVDNEVVGFISLDRQTPQSFSTVHAERLQAFADQAAIAIQNARLHERIRRHAAELEQRVADRTAELDRERKRTQAILDAAGEGILFTDLDGAILYVNPAIERLTGYRSDEIIGRSLNLWKSGHTRREVYDSLWYTIERGEVWKGEVINRHKDGSLYDTSITAAPLRDADNQIVGYVGIQRDITQTKELERLKDQFVSNVSHEIRTPLANVKLYLSLLERGRPEKREQYMQTLHRETARLENLIEDLLDVSRLDLGVVHFRSGPTDVNPILAQLIADRSALGADHSLTLDYIPDPNLPRALADAAMLTQVISNLMSNAINYTLPGGTITLSTAARPSNAQAWVTISVQDTGPGISNQDLPHVFERFYRGEAAAKSGAPGTGLGLSICHDIVERMNGHITVESQPGQGTTFTVWLRPATQP